MTNFTLSRRQALVAAAGAVLSFPALGRIASAADESFLHLGPKTPFSFDKLIAQARALAAKRYVPVVVKMRDLLERIDFDEQMDIVYRPDHTINPNSAAPIRLFHPHKFAKEPTRIHLIEGGVSQEILYNADLFTFGPRAQFAKALPPDVGFAGFRVLNTNAVGDWIAFQGASYFRSSGELNQYGLSTRGIAIDTSLPTPEEFPLFTTFYLEEKTDGVAVYALLEGPSLAGAYRIMCRRPKAVTMDVDMRLFLRKDIKRLGVAPLTSMFWYSELNRAGAPDWRPEVHDSDGLAMWTGSGERLWRPLNNPNVVRTSSFVDRTPRGFGLLQRDRNFEDYEDDGVFYDKRPSVWIEPLNDWGEGSVQLVEIPTDAEIHDNIVAYWVPKEPAKAGGSVGLTYRLHWTGEEPFPPNVGRVVATRRGRGDKPAVVDKKGLIKYVIDFEGGELAKYSTKDPVEPVITLSRGSILNPYALRVVTTDRWRIIYDMKVTGTEPVDMRAYLRKKTGEPLTETWLCQHLPGVA